MQPFPMGEVEGQDSAEHAEHLSVRRPCSTALALPPSGLLSRGQRNFFIGLILVTTTVVLRQVFSGLERFTDLVDSRFFTLDYLVAVIVPHLGLLARISRKSDARSRNPTRRHSSSRVRVAVSTILISATREPSVIDKLLENVARMDYPDSRLEVLVLIEEDDEETLGSVVTLGSGPQFKLVLVPPAEPRTKPKASEFRADVGAGRDRRRL